MNENFEKECIESCKDIAETIEAYANKEVYRCPECNEKIFWSDENYDEETETYTCPHCGETFAEDKLESLYLDDYFDDYNSVKSLSIISNYIYMHGFRNFVITQRIRHTFYAICEDTILNL